MIVCNGCPKSGTHGVMAFLDTMGLKRCPGTILPMGDGVYVDGLSGASISVLRTMPDNVYILAHVPAGYVLDGFRVITVLRDPRNVLLSYIRHRAREDGLQITIEQALKNFWLWGPFVPLYRSFLGWIGRSVVIRYEDMPPQTVGDGAGIYKNHQRDWNTRTGKPSRWQDSWNEQIEVAWQKNGGTVLLAEAGYS